MSESHDNPACPRDAQYYYYYYFYCSEEQPPSSETWEYWNECASSFGRVFLLKIFLNMYIVNTLASEKVFDENEIFLKSRLWKKRRRLLGHFRLPWRENETERQHARDNTHKTTTREHLNYSEKERPWARTTEKRTTQKTSQYWDVHFSKNQICCSRNNPRLCAVWHPIRILPLPG